MRLLYCSNKTIIHYKHMLRDQNYYYYYSVYTHAMCQNTQNIVISSDTSHVCQKKYYLPDHDQKMLFIM